VHVCAPVARIATSRGQRLTTIEQSRFGVSRIRPKRPIRQGHQCAAPPRKGRRHERRCRRHPRAQSCRASGETRLLLFRGSCFLRSRSHRGLGGRCAFRIRGSGARLTGVKLRRQGVRTQAEFHQRFCLREAGSGKAVVRLVVQHGSSRAIIPAPVRISLEVAFTHKRLLDFRHPAGLQMEPRQALPAGEGTAPPPSPPRPMHRGGFPRGSCSRCPSSSCCRGRGAGRRLFRCAGSSCAVGCGLVPGRRGGPVSHRGFRGGVCRGRGRRPRGLLGNRFLRGFGGWSLCGATRACGEASASQ
jgi:hypothetical protein